MKALILIAVLLLTGCAHKEIKSNSVTHYPGDYVLDETHNK